MEITSNMKKSLFYLTAAAMILIAAFVSCTAEIMTLPMGVTLDKKSITLIPGESIILYADVTPDDAVNKSLSWNSSNPGVAVVDNGVVTALAEGATTVTVTINTRLGQQKKSCGVTVAHPVHSITIDKNAAVLSIGERLILIAEVLPDDAPDKSMTWTSSNPAVAEVADGVVIAQKAGTAIVTVTTTIGKRIATCYVKVVEGKYVAMTLQDSQNVTIQLSGSGTIKIDWGDDSACETFTLSSENMESFSHKYSGTSFWMATIESEDITHLDCSNNQLTSLDVSKNMALKTLNCSNNPLLNLDLKNNTALTTLLCIHNQLMMLDVSANTVLENLNCSYNQLTDLDVSSNVALTTLECTRNQLTDLNVNNNSTLKNLNCSNNHLTNLLMNNNAALNILDCSDNPLTILDVSSNVALTHLHCSNNQLTFLDMSNNTALTHLNCQINQLIVLDMSNNTALQFLHCQSNQLSFEAIDALFGTLHGNMMNISKPILTYGNPGFFGITPFIAGSLFNTKRWFVYLIDGNPFMLNPWEMNQ